MKLIVMKTLDPKGERAFKRMVELERQMCRARTLSTLNNLHTQAKKVYEYNFIMDLLMVNSPNYTPRL